MCKIMFIVESEKDEFHKSLCKKHKVHKLLHCKWFHCALDYLITMRSCHCFTTAETSNAKYNKTTVSNTSAYNNLAYPLVDFI